MDNSTAAIVALSLVGCLAATLIYIALLSRHRKAGEGDTGLVGAMARVETTLEPEGAVIVQGELWRARLKSAGEPLTRGRTVRIVGARDHCLEVEPAE